MRTLVIYQSKQGFTKQYAQWIRDELECAILENKNIKPDMLEGYDIIICGSGMYAGNIEGADAVKMACEKSSARNIILFIVGLADPSLDGTKHALEVSITKSLGENRRQVKTFYMQGGIRYGKLNPIYKSMIKMMGKTMKKRGFDSRPEDHALINAKKQDTDFSNKSSINPLIKYVREVGEK